eukprot:PhM_4_TR13266/c0_g1_i1/m.48548/K06636/SMC1; structural maintenance of chromosome 1
MSNSHIVRVEVDNFKSYKGTHTIGPFSNLSCVIGPNGAGKSNITDAIGFCFGVAPHHMRITHYRDLVTTGCTHTAVTVILSVDGTENQITRTLKTSADGTTVKLNGHAVPNKELEAFLLRCNINVRLKNFLVFQHEVESIAQKRAKELTEMIEIVSGSNELREAYVTAAKAYEEANRRMMSVTSEKRETNAEVNRFRMQKKEAERFTDLAERLAKERLELALMQLFHIESQIGARRDALAAAKRELAQLEGKTSSGVEAIKEKKKAYAALHASHLGALKTARDRANDVREKKAMLERLRVNVNHLEARKQRESTELAKNTGQQQTRTAEVARLEAEIAAQEKELKKFEDACAAQDAQDGRVSLTGNNLSEYKRLRKEADTETLTLRQELETARRSRDAQREAVRRAQVTQDDLQARLKEVDESTERADERLQQLTTRLEEGQRELTEAKVQSESLGVNVQALLQSRAQKQEQLQQVQSQLDQLRFTKEENKHQQLFQEAVSAMQATTRGIRGRLLDLCIPNPRYKDAVTVALGKNLEALVVDTQTSALECVRYLKDNRVGIMDFIPLDTAKGKGVDDRHRSFGGTCRPVVDVVKFDSSIEPAIRYALGQTLVCDTVEEARRVAFNSPDGQRYKVVTIDGSMLLKNGAIQGGLQSVKERAKKWDQRSYESLKETRGKLQAELYDSTESSETKAVSDAKAAQARMEAASRNLQRTEDEIATTKNKVKALAVEKKNLLSSIDKGLATIKTFEASLQKCEKEMQAVQTKVKAADQKIFAEFAKKVGISDIAGWEDRESHKSAERAEKRQQYLVLIGRLRNQLDAENKRIGLRSSSDIEVALKRTSDELMRASKELSAQEGIIGAAEKAAEASTKELQKIKAQLDGMEAQIRSVAKRSAEENDAIAKARKIVATTTMATEKLRQERKNVFQRCTLESVQVPVVRGEEARKRAKEGPSVGGRRAKRRGAADDASGDEEDTMVEVSEGQNTSEAFNIEDASVQPGAAGARGGGAVVAIDFSEMPARCRKAGLDPRKLHELGRELEESIAEVEREMDRLAPNLKAANKYATSERKLGDIDRTLDEIRDDHRHRNKEFNRAKERRILKFMQAFDIINENVGRAYKELTEGTRAAGVHGTAYLTLDNVEEPFNGGTKYHPTPPMKRFMGIEALSGGERTIAALALLFALHSVQPAPFVILDEVDAALDTGNVVRLAQYLRRHSATSQFIVVSLKEELFHRADCLLGVYKDKARESSGVLSIDLSAYAE